jgi:hypothetical protein
MRGLVMIGAGKVPLGNAHHHAEGKPSIMRELYSLGFLIQNRIGTELQVVVVALQHFGALQLVQRLLGIAGLCRPAGLQNLALVQYQDFTKASHRQLGNFGLKEAFVQHAHHHAHGFIILIQQFLHQHDAILGLLLPGGGEAAVLAAIAVIPAAVVGFQLGDGLWFWLEYST